MKHYISYAEAVALVKEHKENPEAWLNNATREEYVFYVNLLNESKDILIQKESLERVLKEEHPKKHICELQYISVTGNWQGELSTSPICLIDDLWIGHEIELDGFLESLTSDGKHALFDTWDCDIDCCGTYVWSHLEQDYVIWESFHEKRDIEGHGTLYSQDHFNNLFSQKNKDFIFGALPEDQSIIIHTPLKFKRAQLQEVAMNIYSINRTLLFAQKKSYERPDIERFALSLPYVYYRDIADTEYKEEFVNRVTPRQLMHAKKDELELLKIWYLKMYPDDNGFAYAPISDELDRKDIISSKNDIWYPLLTKEQLSSFLIIFDIDEDSSADNIPKSTLSKDQMWGNIVRKLGLCAKLVYLNRDGVIPEIKKYLPEEEMLVYAMRLHILSSSRRKSSLRKWIYDRINSENLPFIFMDHELYVHKEAVRKLMELPPTYESQLSTIERYQVFGKDTEGKDYEYNILMINELMAYYDIDVVALKQSLTEKGTYPLLKPSRSDLELPELDVRVYFRNDNVYWSKFGEWNPKTGSTKIQALLLHEDIDMELFSATESGNIIHMVKPENMTMTLGRNVQIPPSLIFKREELEKLLK